MRTHSKAFFAVLGVLLLSACGGGDSTGVNGDFTGMYTLKSINDNPIPFTAPLSPTDPTSTITFSGGSFTISSGGTFSETLIYQVFTSGLTTDTTSTCLGTYTQSGNSFAFTEPNSDNLDCGGTLAGSANGSTLTINFAQGVQVVYTK